LSVQVTKNLGLSNDIFFIRVNRSVYRVRTLYSIPSAVSCAKTAQPISLGCCVEGVQGTCITYCI